jgi:5-histidylcysteine sulfoxide synthase/putative 4-mercaptohistidine N1-methyltranferase
MQHLITKTLDLTSGSSNSKRAEILEYFNKTWELDEKLYTQLQSDDIFYHRGDSLRHVLLFYLGHTAVFFINKMFLAKIIDTRINSSFESIFAIGVDEMSWDDLDEKHYQWPSVQEVREYRSIAKELIVNVINTMPIQLPITWEQQAWIIVMGVEHEKIHIETSSVLIRQLPLNEVNAEMFGTICPESAIAPLNEFLPIQAKLIQLGKPSDNPYYGWDNEYGQHTEQVEDFSTSKFLVSNGEFFAFVENKGYENQDFWTEEGWKWRNFRNASMPLFWRKLNDNYFLRLVAQEIPMPWNWPVEVNYLEAKAFCSWKTSKVGKSYRLPTEAEWYCLAEQCNVEEMLNNANSKANIQLAQYSSPCPVDKFKMGDFYDVVGNVWQWTETPITGFAGFKVHPMYDDFTTPTFDGKHNILKGGSWISTGNEATYHARYAFRRHFYQHAGFRIVQSENEPEIHTDEYETDLEVANSCEFMWGNNSADNYANNLAEIVLKTIEDPQNKKLLDLNTDTGRLAFQLSDHFESITAIDSSARFIRMPIQLQQKGFMRYIVKDEGELVFYREIVLSEFGLSKNVDKVQFMQDNANNLKPIYTDFDVVVATNVLEELTCPILFLKNIHERLNSNGVLILASTYDWEANNIKPEHWPGGFKKDGEPLTSFEGISDLLNENFELMKAPQNLLSTFRKSSRNFIQKNNEISCWKRK